MTINPREQLRLNVLGVWTLVTLKAIVRTVWCFYPLGPDLAGQLVYDVSGRMSAQIVRTDQPRFASDDNTQALSRRNSGRMARLYRLFRDLHR